MTSPAYQFTDPDGDWTGNLNIERRTYGDGIGYGFGLGTEYGTAHVVTTHANLVGLRDALDQIIAAHADAPPRLNDDDKFSIEASLAEARMKRPGATRAELVAGLRDDWEHFAGIDVADAAAAWALR